MPLDPTDSRRLGVWSRTDAAIEAESVSGDHGIRMAATGRTCGELSGASRAIGATSEIVSVGAVVRNRCSDIDIRSERTVLPSDGRSVDSLTAPRRDYDKHMVHLESRRRSSRCNHRRACSNLRRLLRTCGRPEGNNIRSRQTAEHIEVGMTMSLRMIETH
jgi:hypothetical protein